MIIARDKKQLNKDVTSWVFYDDSCLIWEVQYDINKDKYLVISGPHWWTARVIPKEQISTLTFLRDEDIDELLYVSKRA